MVTINRAGSKRSESRRKTLREEERHRESLSQAKKLGLAAVAVPAMVGLVLGPLFFWLNHTDARTESLEVQSWAIGYTIQDETVTEPAAPSKAPVTRPANVATLDLAVRNRGAVASLITGTTLTVTEAVQPRYCATIGGPLEVAEAYDVVLPGISARMPIKLIRDQLFTVESGANDRYQIRMTADAALEDGVSFVPTVYTAQIVIEHDDGDELDVGSVAFLSPPYKLAAAYQRFEYDGGIATLAECLATVGRTFTSAMANADLVAADLVCYAELYERASNAILAGSELPTDTCEKTMSPLDRPPVNSTSSNPSDPSEAICLLPCRTTGRVSFAHPTWGNSSLLTTQAVNASPPGTQIYESQIVVVDEAGVVIWRHRAGDWHEIAPADISMDETGHIFLNYNPGRYNGVIILNPTGEGFQDFATLPAPGEFAQRFYSAQLYDADADGVYEVHSEVNTCQPSCANANYETTIFRWDGQDYVAG